MLLPIPHGRMHDAAAARKAPLVLLHRKINIDNVHSLKFCSRLLSKSQRRPIPPLPAKLRPEPALDSANVCPTIPAESHPGLRSAAPPGLIVMCVSLLRSFSSFPQRLALLFPLGWQTLTALFISTNLKHNFSHSAPSPDCVPIHQPWVYIDCQSRHDLVKTRSVQDTLHNACFCLTHPSQDKQTTSDKGIFHYVNSDRVRGARICRHLLSAFFSDRLRGARTCCLLCRASDSD